MAISIGISTCPNDTFTFAALLERRVPGPELAFTLGDVEALNERVIAGELDVSKASFHAAIAAERDYTVLPVGAALGFGVGPLLLARRGRDGWPGAGDRVLCPGRWTTATLLYRLYATGCPSPAQCLFSDIMPVLERGDADHGVVIHEGRFTYEERGLHRVADLGELWEQDTGLPLPLGGIVARRSLGAATHESLTRAIRASLAIARRDPSAALPVMARHAQELSREVLEKHVELYVNAATEDLGEEGRRALGVLAAKARRQGGLDA